MWGHLGPTLRLMNQAAGGGPSFRSPKVPQVILLCALGSCLHKNDGVQDRVVSELGLDLGGDGSSAEAMVRAAQSPRAWHTGPQQYLI